MAALALMMMTPITYAVIELCRVPLAIAARTQRSIGIKALAIFGVLLAAAVTVKSLSQLGEQMFHPRLEEVVKTKQAVKLAKAEQATFDQKSADAEAVVKQRADELSEIEDRSQALTGQLATVAKPTCQKISGKNKKGASWTSMKCVDDPKGPIIQASLKQAQDDRAASSTKLDEARAARAKFDRDAVDRKVNETETKAREAVMNSQLHSFAAMLFAIDPSEVTDAQVHEFLRLFVFIPAICAALAATLLASAAVEIIPPEDAGTVTLPADVGLYALGGLAEDLVRQTIEGVQNTGKANIASGVTKGQQPPSLVPTVVPAAA
jgi:hypothetical protein